MKKLILLSTICCGALIGNAQKTLPAGTKIQAMNRPVSTSLYDKLKSVVPPGRQAAFSGTFNPPSIRKNVNGVNIVSTAVINSTNADNVTTKPVPNSSQATSEPGFDCVRSRELATADSKSFLSVTANGDGIYPGAIFDFTDFMNGNFLKEVGVGKRNPIQIYTNNLANSTGDVSVTVNNPTSVNIYNSIASLVRNNSTTNVSATQIGQYIYSQNQANLLLSISGGGAYSGFSASAGFTLNKQNNHIYVTCDFKIPLYTLYTNFPANGFLSDPNLERTPNLVLINSVTYGTRVLVNIDIDESSLSTEAKAKFQYGDPTKAGFNVDLNFLMSNKNIKHVINTYVVGAKPSNLGNPMNVDQVYAFVDACIKNTNYQTAKPITYTLSTMGGDLVGIKSATDEYTVVNCVPKQTKVFIGDVSLSINTKGNYKEAGSNVAFNLYVADGGKMIASAPNNNGQFGPNGDNPVGLSMIGAVPLSDLSLGKNYLEIDLDRPNCVLSCDDWEIDNVMVTINFKDENNGTPLPRKMFTLCSSAFVLQKGKVLRLEFDSNFKPLSQYLRSK